MVRLILLIVVFSLLFLHSVFACGLSTRFEDSNCEDSIKITSAWSGHVCAIKPEYHDPLYEPGWGGCMQDGAGWGWEYAEKGEWPDLSTFEGYECKLHWRWSCNKMAGGVWDPDDMGCIFRGWNYGSGVDVPDWCDGGIQTGIENNCDFEGGAKDKIYDECEEACGAPPECDELEPCKILDSCDKAGSTKLRDACSCDCLSIVDTNRCVSSDTFPGCTAPEDLNLASADSCYVKDIEITGPKTKGSCATGDLVVVNGTEITISFKYTGSDSTSSPWSIKTVFLYYPESEATVFIDGSCSVTRREPCEWHTDYSFTTTAPSRLGTYKYIGRCRASSDDECEGQNELFYTTGFEVGCDVEVVECFEDDDCSACWTHVMPKCKSETYECDCGYEPETNAECEPGYCSEKELQTNFGLKEIFAKIICTVEDYPWCSGERYDCVPTGTYGSRNQYLCYHTSPSRWIECNEENLNERVETNNVTYICVKQNERYEWVTSYTTEQVTKQTQTLKETQKISLFESIVNFFRNLFSRSFSF